MKLVLAQAGLITATLMAAASAQASIVFTFTTGGGGTIGGHIDGLADIAGLQVATHVVIDSFSGAAFPASFTVPYDYGGGGSFAVSAGALTLASFVGFRAGNSATQFSFDLAAPSFNLQSFNNGARLTGSNLAFSSFAQAATVPEPGAGLLVLTALAGMAAVGRPLRRRARPTAAV